MGTSEIYRAVLALDEIVDALVVDVPREGAENWMALFVVLRDGCALDDDLRRAIARRIREDCSPRHVPDDVFAIAAVPRTLSGKLLEVPVKRILVRHAARARREPRLAREPRRAGLVRRARARARSAVSRTRAKKKQRRRARVAAAGSARSGAARPARERRRPGPLRRRRARRAPAVALRGPRRGRRGRGRSGRRFR